MKIQRRQPSEYVGSGFSFKYSESFRSQSLHQPGTGARRFLTRTAQQQCNKYTVGVIAYAGADVYA
jgi:hypothetical protein